MKKKVADKDKPKWFDLSKYESLKNLSNREWSFQLNARAAIFGTYQKNTLRDRHDTTEIDREFFEEIKRTPVLSIKQEYEEFTGRSWINESHPNPYSDLYKDYVFPLSFSRAYHNFLRLPDPILAAFNSEDGCPSELGSLLPVEYFDLESGLATGPIIDLSIDLTAPDKKILADFKDYLKSAREIHGFKEGGEIKESIADRFINNSVLPYLDLTIWAIFEDIHITQPVMAKWIFKPEILNGVEKLKRSTIRWAVRAISPNYIKTLEKM